MTIASEITRINNNIAAAYTACDNKGATIPATADSANLATCISTIPTGSTPTLITKSITSNGTYNASSDNADGYSSVTVNVSSIGIPREVSLSGKYQMPSSDFTFTLPSNATDVAYYALAYAMYNSKRVVGVDLSSLTSITGGDALYYAFRDCTNLLSADISGLQTINTTYAFYYTFYNCTSLEDVDLSSLTTINNGYNFNNTFYGCSKLEDVDFSSLTTINGTSTFQNAFTNCTSLTSLSFPSLTSIDGNNAFQNAFTGCSTLSSVSFPSLETIGSDTSSSRNSHFYYAFPNNSLLTTLSFPELTTIYCTGSSASNGTFSGNTGVQKMYFPKLTTITYGTGASSSNQNACKNIFYNCTSLTELHFGRTNQSAIEATAGYSTAWGRGAGNVTIYFDL